jgi:hypothetical protein
VHLGVEERDRQKAEQAAVEKKPAEGAHTAHRPVTCCVCEGGGGVLM